MAKASSKRSAQRASLAQLLRRIGRAWPALVVSTLLTAATVVLQLYVPILFGDAIDQIAGAGKVHFARLARYLQEISLLVALCMAVTLLPVSAITAWAEEGRQLKIVDGYPEGSIDANRGDYQNGWDTDQFPIDNYELTQAMMQIIRNGGLGNGGTNFDAKTRRNSTDLEDIFIAHIAGMDAMARALESAAALLNESPYKKMLADRYASFDGGKGKEFEDGKLTLEDVVAYAKANGEPKQTSGKQELYEAILNMYC